MQFQYRIDEANKLIGMTRLRDNGNNGRPLWVEIGAMLNHDFAPYFSGGIGYRHGNSTSDMASDEERAMSEQTFRASLPSKVEVDFRTREDLRWLSTGFSARFRERGQIERAVEIEGYTFTSFASAEVFWDTRYDQFSRYRLIVGATLPVHRGLSVQPYLDHQITSVPISSVVDIVGLVLIMSF
jgi:hypothetical protein